MMGVSDGLTMDLSRLCRESEVGAEIRLSDVPVAAGLDELAGVLTVDPLDLALSGGEDYELLATVPPEAVTLAASQLRERFGTALTDIGAMRRSADLMRSLVDPAGEVRPENRSIRVVMKDGRTLTGRFLNQDTFSIQLIDATDKMLSIDKSTVRESSILSTSLMPLFKDKLNAQDLADVVSYLSSLKGRP